MNQGELLNFKLQAFLDVANELVRADEVILALKLLDNLPGFYRDNRPVEIVELKNKILSRIATPSVYANSPVDANIDTDDRNKTSKTLRGQLIFNEVKWWNSRAIVPHIVDYGPGEYWLPFVLKKEGLKFTYQPVYLAKEAYEKAKALLTEEMIPKKPEAPTIYIACEIIEHLWNEEDLKTEMLASCGYADVIHISTPRYTHGNLCLDWAADKQELGHLRTYTPQEFSQKIIQMFPEYQVKVFNSFIMHARLVKRGFGPEEVVTLFDQIKITNE